MSAGASVPAAVPSWRGRLEHWVPGVRVVRTYQRAWLPRDMTAGIVLVTLLVPQGMAYAELAGLPPITGLYTTVVCLVAYALIGPSPILVLGPDSSLGPMIAATILPLAAGNQEQAIALAGMLALLVGLITLGAGLARLGFVADLLSSPVRTGYLAGLAVVILVGQLPKLFGFKVDADGLVAELVGFVRDLDMTNLWALGIGLSSLIIILALQRLAPRLPGILIAVAVAIVLSVVLDLAARGVAVIGVLPQGFPIPAFPAVPTSDIPALFAAAIGISLVAVGDTISTSGGFARRAEYEVDGNQELAGIGSANLAAGLFSGFPVSTSGSRTAVAFQSGAKTQLTGLVAAALVLIMLFVAPGLVQAMPQPVLAAVVIAASLSLFDLAELRRLRRIRSVEFVLAVACGLGVAFIGVLQGIVLAVVLSVIYIFQRAWSPYSAVLGRPPGIAGYHDVQRFPDAEQVPGLLIVRWSAPLFFANSNLFRDRIRELVAAAGPTSPRWVLVAAAPIVDIDTTAGAMLDDLDRELNAAGIHLAFAELQDTVRDHIVRYGLLETIDQGHLYRSVDEAVEAYQSEGDGAG
ncbi:MAG: SulP family inorganic anion transporter [Candidatus Limnocylindrales bacterium]